MYTLEDYIPDAIEMVSAWDVPDEQLADAINAQAKLMSGITPDESWEEVMNEHRKTGLSTRSRCVGAVAVGSDLQSCSAPSSPDLKCINSLSSSPSIRYH